MNKQNWSAEPGLDAEMALPVTSEPAPGESLRSYIGRVAELNNMRPDELAPMTGPQRIPDLEALAKTLGVQLDALTALTWAGYPPAIGGRRGSTGWLLRQHRWWCPMCLESTGVWQRTWELACLPVCFTCHRTLTAGDSQHHGLDPTEMEAFRDLAHRIEESRLGGRTATWLARLLRVTRLLAVACDTDWPRRLTAENARALQSWSKHPPSTPNGLAELLPFATKLIDSSRESYFVAEGWRRIKHRPHDMPHTLLPKRPTRDRPWAELPTHRTNFDDLSRGRVTQLIRILQDLDVDTIPALIPTQPNEFLPPPADWAEAQELALVIHMLACPRSDTKPGWLTQAVHHFHLLDAPRSPMIDALQLRRTITADDAQRVEDAIVRLLEVEAVDYRVRRQVLRQVRRLRRLPTIDQPAPLLGGWVWVYLTRGRIVGTSPTWAHSDSPLATFRIVGMHAQLTLHERMLLAEYADGLWANLSGIDLLETLPRTAIEVPSHVEHHR